MTTRYVGIGGSDANNGLSWATRKLTLNGVEDTPVVAGDTVYVGPGTYRELLTVDISGSAGNIITYIGDYTGANTDGVGGLVRVTGSDNDQTAARGNCITASTKIYRTFQGFQFDTSSSTAVNLAASCTNWIINKCFFDQGAANGILVAGASQSAITVSNCFFRPVRNQVPISYTHTVVVDNAAHVIENCIFQGPVATAAFTTSRVGGIAIKNCGFWGSSNAVLVGVALTVGQTVTVNNCLFQSCTVGVQGTVTGEIIEDYNSFFGNTTNRSNTATGANSLAYPALLDTRWFFQMTHEGAGPSHATQVISPFDLASFSQIINVAGTAPTTTDMRGTAVQGAQREWGALEYDNTLKIEGAAASSGQGWWG
jgi:hypothetical protein